MRLIDLNPRWINNNATGRRGLGVSFDCMTGHCSGRLRVLFSNPIDGGPQWEDRDESGAIDEKFHWIRSGNTFENLSLTPSINANDTDAEGNEIVKCGHKNLTNGVFSP